MEDLKLLASYSKGTTASWADEFLRAMLEVGSPRSYDSMLMSLRWHFLLGSLPLTFSSTKEMQQVCQSAREAMVHTWRSIRATRGLATGVLAADVNGSPLTSTTTPGSPLPSRRAKFDSSSSSSASSSSSSLSAAVGVCDREHGRKTRTEPKECQPAVPENPLLPSKGSQYEVQFHEERVRRDIEKDVDRLYWEVSLFEEPRSKKDITEILTNYCVSERCDYRQGLHEVVAFLYYVAHRDRSCYRQALKDKQERGAEDNEALSPDIRAWATLFEAMSSNDSLLPCTFALFKQVMSVDSGLGLVGWYYAAKDDGGAHEERSVPNGGSPSPAQPFATGQSGVVAAADRVQQEILRALDSELHHRLVTDYSIQGATYLLRWLRLLFLREFSLGQSIAVWTLLFAEMRLCRVRCGSFSIQDSIALYLAAVMIEFVREELMLDHTRALQRLMRFPPVEDIRSLLTAACTHSHNHFLHVYAPQRQLTLSSEAAKAASFASLTATQSPHLSNALASPCIATGDEQKEAMLRQGDRLSAIVKRLERLLVQPSVVADAPSDRQRTEDELIIAVAELKKVRDVLMFGVDD